MPSRRELLAGGTAVTTLALAGCIDSLDPTGGSDDRAVTDWIGADVFGETPVRVERPAQLAGVEAFDYENLLVRELPGLASEDVDLAVSGRDGPFVLIGGFEAETVVDEFGDISVEAPQSAGSYGGYDVYDVQVREGDGTLVLGVDDGEAVVAGDRDRVETTVDASQGNATRLAEADSQFEQLQAAFEGAPFYQIQRPDSASDVLLGVEAAFEDDETTVTLVTALGDGGDAEAFGENVTDLLAAEDLADTGVEVDGGTVRTTGTLPTDDLASVEAIAELFGPVLRYFGDTVAGGPVAPQVAFDYNYDQDSETLTLTFVSGDTFTAGQVQFRGSGFDNTGASWAEVAGEGVTAESSVTAGDRVQLQGVAPAVELDLVWLSADGGESAIIASFSGPDA